MPRPKRILLATAEQTSTPPEGLTDSQMVVKTVKAAGNNLYQVTTTSGQNMLVEMPARFRSSIWVKRGTYLVVDTSALAGRNNKISGEIANVVRDEKEWRKQSYWPKEFEKKSSVFDESDGEDSTVGKMPPSDSEDEM